MQDEKTVSFDSPQDEMEQESNTTKQCILNKKGQLQLNNAGSIIFANKTVSGLSQDQLETSAKYSTIDSLTHKNNNKPVNNNLKQSQKDNIISSSSSQESFEYYEQKILQNYQKTCTDQVEQKENQNPNIPEIEDEQKQVPEQSASTSTENHKQPQVQQKVLAEDDVQGESPQDFEFGYENLDQNQINQSEEHTHIQQNVNIYCEKISEHLFKQQRRFVQAAAHTQIHQNKRAFIIDWIVLIHNKFELKCETLFMSVKVFDNYIEKQLDWSPEQLQSNECLRLIASAAIFISCKYEEIYPPQLKDLSNVTHTLKKDILFQEGLILLTLQFNLTMPNSLNFLDILCVYDPSITLKQKCLANFLLHLSLHDTKHLQILPSKLASSAVLVAKKLSDLQNQHLWNNQLQQVTGYQQQELEELANQLYQLLLQIHDCKGASAFIKFCSAKFLSVALNTQLPQIP